MSSLTIFQQAELAYHQGDAQRAFDGYQRAIKKILKDENLYQTVPIPKEYPDMPKELIAVVWRNFVGFFRDPKLPDFTRDKVPEAYKLLTSFRPKSGREFPRFRGDKLKLVLKAMQITAALTMGLLAWDVNDRPTAAKYYQEGLDLAETLPERVKNIETAEPHLEKWIAGDVKEARDNLEILMQTDEVRSLGLRSAGIEGGDLRKDVVNLPNTHIEPEGHVTIHDSVVTATDTCAKCGKRGVKFSRCGACKRVAYCGTECQKLDWKQHKPACKTTTSSVKTAA